MYYNSTTSRGSFENHYQKHLLYCRHSSICLPHNIDFSPHNMQTKEEYYFQNRETALLARLLIQPVKGNMEFKLRTPPNALH